MGDLIPLSMEDPQTGQFRVVGEAEIEEVEKGKFHVTGVVLDRKTRELLGDDQASFSIEGKDLI